MLNNRSLRIFLSVLIVLLFAFFQARTSLAQIDYPSFPAAGLSFAGDGGFEGNAIRLIRTLPPSAQVAAAACCQHVVVSQTPTPPPGRFADLTLEISVPNRSYLPLEPIPITVKISNHTALGILGHGSTDFSSGYLRFDVKNAAGEERVFDRPSLELANNIIQRKIIPSGGHFQKTQILSFSLDRYMMSEGNYKLRAVFSNGNDESIRSAWADIRITRPSVLELGALEYLKKQTNVSSFLHVIGDDEDADNHNSFIIQFPNTRYSEHALFLLGEHYYYRDDYVRAKQYFSQLNANKDFIFADRVDQYLEKLSKK